MSAKEHLEAAEQAIAHCGDISSPEIVALRHIIAALKPDAPAAPAAPEEQPPAE